jgi:uracil-DNA glycosylase family 4
MSIKEEVLNCTKCPLRNQCISPIPGVGKKSADWMFIYPRPPNQMADKFLNKILDECKVDINTVYITSVLKCPSKVTPKGHKQYSKICQSHLLNEIEKIQPKVIFLLGLDAVFPRLKEFLKITNSKLLEGESKIMAFNLSYSIKYKQCYHPSALLNRSISDVNAFKVQILEEIVPL